MSRAGARAAWYWARASAPRQRGALLAVVLLVGLVGGVAMGAIAAARRTQAAFPAYLAASHASDLQLFVYLESTNGGLGLPDLSSRLSHLDGVAHVASVPTMLLYPQHEPGASELRALASDEVEFLGSRGGAYVRAERPVVDAGRMFDPADPDEVVASALAARILHWRLGTRLTFDVFNPTSVQGAVGYPPDSVRPLAVVHLRLVGLVTFADQVAHDQVDQFPVDVLATPALTRRYAAAATSPSYLLGLHGGAAGVSAVEREVIQRLLPFDSVYEFHLTSVVEGQVERATRPTSLALGAFGLIAALVVLLLGAQAIRRTITARAAEARAAAALGADRNTQIVALCAGPAIAVLAGVAAAVGVAVALSPLSPLGPVRQIDPDPGFAIDVPVALTGALLAVLALLAAAVAAAALQTRPHHARDDAASRSRVAEAAARAGVPAPAVTGLRFALSRTAARTSFRPAIAATILSVVVVTTTVTFASGLTTLVSHPELYGWDFDALLTSPSGTNLPPVVDSWLREDHDVAADSSYSYANVQVDGITEPLIILSSPHPTVGLALVAGHQIDGVGQIILGSQTLAALHKRLGQTVVASYGYRSDYPVWVPPTRVTIVGVATLPAIGSPGTLHTSMGLGAVLATGVEPPWFRAALHRPDENLDGPDAFAVRLRPGASPAAALGSLRAIATRAEARMAADPLAGPTPYEVLGAQRPAEIVAYQSSGATPALLALALAAGAVAGLGLALATSVRRRRRDLATLKTLGFTRRQLAATIASQATVAAVVGCVVGIPVGVALGRWLWDTFATQIGAVPDATVPVVQLVIIALGALLLANVVAAVPGRIAARTPAAAVLRSE